MGNNKTEKEVLLDVQHLKKYFEVGKNQTLKAVDDVTLQIYKGETLGLVGRVRDVENPHLEEQSSIFTSRPQEPLPLTE